MIVCVVCGVVSAERSVVNETIGEQLIHEEVSILVGPRREANQSVISSASLVYRVVHSHDLH